MYKLLEFMEKNVLPSFRYIRREKEKMSLKTDFKSNDIKIELIYRFIAFVYRQREWLILLISNIDPSIELTGRRLTTYFAKQIWLKKTFFKMDSYACFIPRSFYVLCDRLMCSAKYRR